MVLVSGVTTFRIHCCSVPHDTNHEQIRKDIPLPTNVPDEAHQRDELGGDAVLHHPLTPDGIAIAEALDSARKEVRGGSATDRDQWLHNVFSSAAGKE